MKILITGATGFIGNHLINELLRSNTFEIIATSRNKEKAKDFSWFSKVQYIQYDFNNSDKLNLHEYFSHPNKLIHLAWEGLPNYNDLIHIEKNLFNHYVFIKNLISNGLKDITVAGTCFEYGMINGCLNENMNTQPNNAYPLAKDSLRKFIEELSKNFEFRYKWVRLFYMYGKGQNSKSLLAQLETAIQNGDEVFNMSGGEQLRDYLTIQKIAENISKIATQNKINGIINCCSGKPISIRSLVENIISQNNYKIKLNLGYYPYSNYEPMAFWGDNKKLNTILKGFDES